MDSENRLSDSWTIWMHNAKDSNWTKNSYIKIAEFDTVESFWAYFNLLTPELFSTKMFFFMRNNTQPIWEDPNVNKGGYWSFKVTNTNLLPTLESIIINIIIDNFGVQSGQKVYGLTTSPKRGFHIIKIWNNNERRRELSKKDMNLLNASQSDIIYTPFRCK